MPKNAKLVVVDDASEVPVPEATFRFDVNVGVATAKNKCLELAEGADFIYLLDDDVRIKDNTVWQKYIDSGENCLMYQFKLPNKPKTDMSILCQDDRLTSYSHTRGCFIFLTSRVLEVVGGFDTRFYNQIEHADYVNRIHNAGLTKYRAADLTNSHNLLYCLDQDGKVESSIKDARPDYKLYNRQRKSKEYRAYK